MPAKTVVRSIFVLFFLMNLVSLFPATAQTSRASVQVPSRIVAPIDNSVRVTIPHSTHPMALSAYEVGTVDGNTAFQRMILVLGGSADQEYQARTLVDSQQTKGSPDYHHWLTPEEYGQKFGPSSQDVAQVTAWLQQQGFTVGSVAKSGRWLEFSGTSAQVEAAFQTQMRQYLVNGELHVANATNISIPAALSPVVRGLLSLHNFYSQPMMQRSKTVTAPVVVNRSRPNATDSNGDHFVTPGDVATIYDLNPLYNGATSVGSVTGAGQTIALVAIGNINLGDIGSFQSVFGLQQNLPNIILNGPDPGIDGASDEASLDVEYSGAVAPGATIDLVVSGGTLTTDPIALSASFIVDQNLAGVMSASFGICEAALGGGGTILNPGNAFWNSLWEQAAAQGISVFVSTGDTGAAGCDPNGSTVAAAQGLAVNGIGSTPFNTAVGGTEFNEGATPATFWNASNNADFSSVIGYIPETVWNDSCSPTNVGSFCQQLDIFSLASAGGGISTIYGVPGFQTQGTIEGLTGAGFPNRPVPDVSLDASNDHDPYIFCFTAPDSSQDCAVSGNTVTFSSFAGGTSFSSPEFAGIMALVDQAAGGRQGLANQTLYALAANESASFSACTSSSRTNPGAAPPAACIFNDVTTGNNGVPGNDTLSAFIPPGDISGQLGYNAEPGYDPAIGLGSVNAALLVNAWASLSKGFEGSTTTLTTNPTTVNITHGQTVSVSVSVAKQSAAETGTPSGSVSLLATGGNLPSNVGITSEPITGSGGTATAGPVNVNNLPGGTAYSLMASFPGDGTFAGSTSSAITVSVSPENTTTTLQSFLFNIPNQTTTPGGTSVNYGDPNNILLVDADTAGVSGLLPSIGSVTFDFSATPVQTPIDNSGIAEIADCFSPLTACLPPGTYTVSAGYSGDGLSYKQSSSSAAISITVNPGNPTPAVQAPPVVGIGDSFALGAVIGTGLGSITPTGTVQFMNNGSALGNPVTLSGGQASAQATFTAASTNSVTVQYSGDSTYNAATSQPVLITAVQNPFGLSATTTSATITVGQTAVYNVTLTGNSGFSGIVNFNCTGAPGGSNCVVTPSPATLSASTTSVPITVTVLNTSNARLGPGALRSLPLALAGLLAVVVLGSRRNPRRRLLVLMLLGVSLIAGVTACGGGGNTSTSSPISTTLTVTATSGSISSAITLNLTINQ